ncbi:MAG: NUDIX hydrolase [Candidatus Kaelpia aquatica]|nr:NUDIX hydrolase [Candidatus Kaelpia aquatica]
MVKRELSCGGILYRRVEDSFQIALVKRLRKNGLTVWCIPKGKVEEGESHRETALREVREETGMNGIIESDLGNINYWFYDTEDKVKINKKVYFFLMAYKDGDLGDHDSEVEEVRWVGIDDVLDCMSYDSEKDIVEKSKNKLLEKGVA